jgi:hypothetical protein
MRNIFLTLSILTIFLFAFSFNPIQNMEINSLPANYSWSNDCDIAYGVYGSSVASAGDVNNDGYDDVIIGAYLAESGYNDEGLAFVYLGSDTGISPYPCWTNGPNQATAHYGISVASAGDVNGDGYGDIIVGAEYYDRDNSNEGQAFVYLGNGTSPEVFPYWTGESNQANSQYGFSVASAGDVNGDTLDDIIVGAFMFDNGQTDEGKAYLYFGSDSAISSFPDWEEESDISYANFGCSVASAGDVNGDGYDDVIIGAYSYSSTKANEGAVFVYYGSSSGLPSDYSWQAISNQANSHFGYSVATAGDVNGDGYDDVVIGAYTHDNGQTDEGVIFVYLGDSLGLSATPQMIEINSANSQFGYSVASAGDVNNDGYDDIIVGANQYSNSLSYEGGAFLFCGSAGGMQATPSWTYESNQFQALLGYSVASAGDVNNDGYDDVLAGSIYFDNGETDEGCAFGFYGEADPAGLNKRISKEIHESSISLILNKIILTCSEAGAEVNVFDSAGRCVFRQSNLNSGINEIKTDMMNRGIFFIKLTDSKSILIKKAVLIK